MSRIRKKSPTDSIIKRGKLKQPLHILMGMLTFFLPCSLIAESFPVLPEFQVYHTIGTRGSTYTSGSAGFTVHLFDEDGGPGRYLHLLGITVSSKTSIWQNRLGKVFVISQGKGYEFGVHDQWTDPSGKGATLSLRHIDWEETQLGARMLGKASMDQLHMGWSWSVNGAGYLVWLLGLDIATLHLPSDRASEIQLALGMRTVF